MKFCLTFLNFTGCRAATLRSLDAVDFERKRHGTDNPRCFQFNPDKIKNDAAGELHPTTRQSLVPCLCLQIIDNYRDKVKFAKALRFDPDTPCVQPCPYDVCAAYSTRKRPTTVDTKNTETTSELTTQLCYLRKISRIFE